MRSTAVIGACALALAGCSETLDAGSTKAGAGLTADPTTRATFDALIDAVAMDATSLYLTCEDGYLYRVDKAGSAPPSRVAHAAAPGSDYTEGLALDDTYAYWTALGDGLTGGVVLRAPKAGGAVETIASGRARPWGIAVDDASVYWADQGGALPSSDVGGIGEGAILRAPKAGGGVVEIASMLNAPDSLTLLGDEIVWHEGVAIRAAPAAGGDVSTWLTLPTLFRTPNLVASAARVAWAQNDGEDGSIWSSDAADHVATLAAGVDPPASLAITGETLAWNVATGPDAGAI
ncbi:MAG TPA: hypothetical protein VGM56_24235, partial [Byssovorax sp.]